MISTTYLHDGWEFIQTKTENHKIGFSSTEWLPAQVPGQIHADLYSNGIIADPLTKAHELGVQWVDETDWSYRLRFKWSSENAMPHRVLRFEGLDTVCTVRLNGEVIAEHDNMFVPLEVDVTAKLTDGENELRIDFLSASEVGEERRTAWMAEQELADPIERLRERSFVRKAQYMYGWDWGPRIVSCGIWQPVKLLEFSSRVTDFQVRYDLIGENEAKVWVELATEGPAAEWIVDLVDAETDELVATFNSEDRGPKEVGDLERWSPDNPYLYRAIASLVGEDDEVIDEVEVPVGFVTCRLLREPDSHGESFEFEVNGRKTWIFGANWIPDHSLPSVITKERYRQQIVQAKDMGINMLRVWGGGLYELDAFYEVCNEEGMMVWQDFMFACAYYPDDAKWQEVIRVEAEANVRRLRNHPSLVTWCGNNENHQMWSDKWGGLENSPPRYLGLALYNETISAVLASLDPSRPYIESSAMGAKDTPLENPNGGGKGDQHCWDVWHGRGDWKHYADSTARFSSEYGFVSSCNLSTWRKALEREDVADLPADHFQVRWHDKTGKGYETYLGYVALHYPKPATVADLVYYSQLNQRDALRFGIEHYRRSDFCRGSIIWQINDCWAVQSWAFVDSEGEQKVLAYELSRLYDERLLSFVRKNETLDLWAVNDGDDAWMDEVTVVATHTETGEVLKVWSADLSATAGQRHSILSIDLTGLNVHETLVIAETESGERAWTLLQEPKSMRLSGPETLVVSGAEEGMLTIKATGPLVDLVLTDAGSTLPFEANGITIGSGGTFQIPVRYVPDQLEARSLAGVHPIRWSRGAL